ncbi:hypothetical protein GKD14_16320 [Paeniclostridium sordellii]|nr:hypothetical protein [Paeniclostridium sordellii]MSB60507.1 hypothetical protein [Paeniclostridium sordellii]
MKWSYDRNVKCKKCESEYEVYVMKIPMKDKDYEVCTVCGEKLFSWKECRMYDARLIKNDVEISDK